jgi:hypothetical protein
MTLTVTPDRALVRTAGKSQRYVLVEIEAPVSSTTKPRLPLNFAGELKPKTAKWGNFFRGGATLSKVAPLGSGLPGNS